MSYRLNKPFTAEEKDNFIFKYNQDCFHEGYHCRIEETDEALFALEDNEIMVDGEPVIDPDYEEKQKQEEEIEFNRKFFNTSLGYVSRDVHMLNGDIKDFLTDILPLLQEGVEIYTYTANKEQMKVAVTEQFIGECKQQVLVDFYGIQD